MLNKVLIVDFGSAEAQPLARRVREAGVYSEMVPGWAGLDEIKRRDPAAIILAGDGEGAAEILKLGLPAARHCEVAEGGLQKFLDGSGLKADWNMASFVERAIADMKARIGERKVICGLSGGVDSSVVAVLLSKAVGDNLHCIFVDHGLLRQGEVEEVRGKIAAHYKLNMTLADASETFLSRLKGVDDPERKRKIIGHTFIEVFEAEAAKLGKVDFLAQGTIYPDVIESFSAKGPGAVIKSHHNVGGLPEKMNMSLVEPLRELFKDEVRQAAAVMGMPHDFIWRHPFPGPGLAIRVLGPVDRERLDILRRADAVMREELHKSGLYEKVWQAFAVILPLKTVGIKADSRTYENVIALRAVNSRDAMTAEWARLPYDFLDAVSRRIINEVEGAGRVVYDISSKPPATIEWE